jgi:hypothetical protein
MILFRDDSPHASVADYTELFHAALVLLRLVYEMNY